MSKEPILTTKDLAIGYTKEAGSISLFENLNLQLYPEQLVCFMGPNGVGKSTLIRTLAGLHPILKGHIHVGAGRVVPDKISVVLTDKVSSLNMKVEELVTFGRYPYMGWNASLSNNDKEKISNAVEATKIQHLLGRKVYELSDGQMQLVMIARALAQDTPIILLDEPTAHLDLNNRVELMNLLRRFTRETSKAILIATHELDLALQTADLIWLAGNDKKIKTGIPEDLVLSGGFDEVFRFKGFDLRTGKVLQVVTRKIIVNVEGEGHEYLWTKNALERCGFGVDDSSTSIVHVGYHNGRLRWKYRENSVDSIKALIDLLEDAG